MPIQVLLADDHTLFRQGLRLLLDLEDDIEVVGEAANGLEAHELVTKLSPNVALIDINMPVADGVVATQNIVRDRPETGVIILTMYVEEAYVIQAIRAGARGYLLKTTPVKELAAAVRTVYRGASSLDPAMTTTIITEFRRLTQEGGYANGFGGLTEKEIGLLRLLGQGLSNRDIARKMHYSESTVKNKLSLLFDKIGVRDRTQAAIYAVKLGLIATSKLSFWPDVSEPPLAS